MPIRLGERVKESSSSTGAATITLAGAQAKCQAFSAVANDNDLVPYLIVNNDANEWETGLGRYAASVLTRYSFSIFGSSAGGALVTFGAGTKTVALTHSSMLSALGTVGAGIATSGGSFYQYFGDGSDGDLDISSGTTTITSAKKYRRIRITGSGALNTNGYDVRAWVTDLSAAAASAIRNTGGNGGNGSTAAGTAGTAPGVGGIGGADSAAGKAGGEENVNGTAGGNVGGVGGAGGAGGAGGKTSGGVPATTGGAKGTVSGSYTVTGLSSYLDSTGSLVAAFAAIEGGSAGGSGGGGAFASGTEAGGGGSGGGGGVVLLVTALLIVDTTGTAAGAITANGGTGGNGGNGSSTEAGGGGGGAGAGAGWVNVVYMLKVGSKTGAITANGGTGGNGGNAGSSDDGGTGGGGGAGGRSTTLDLISGTVTNNTGSAGSAGSAPAGTVGGAGGAGGTLSANL